MTEFRAWVGCLGCYNEGRLNGEWLDASDCDDLPAHLPTAQLATYEGTDSEYVRCTRCGSDEWWCFDTELSPFIDGECSPHDAWRVGEALAEIERDDVDLEAVLAWITACEPDIKGFEWDGPTRESFEDVYRGEQTLRETADQWAQDQIDCFTASTGRMSSSYVTDQERAMRSGMEWLTTYFDWDKHARDFEMDHTEVTRDGRTFTFYTGA